MANNVTPLGNVPPTLTTINDDVLLLILQYLPLTCMRTLECTSVRLHNFTHNPRTATALFQITPRHKALSRLTQFPRWALQSNGAVLAAILAGPKPPLIDIETLLDVPRFGPLAAVSDTVRTKLPEWYPPTPLRPSRDVILIILGKVLPWSVSRFGRIFEQASSTDNVTVDDMVKLMLEDEMFPMATYFPTINKNAPPTLTERLMLQHPKVRQHIKLSDLLPRVRQYLVYRSTVDILRSIYSNAPPSDKIAFDQHLQHLIEASDHWGVFQGVMLLCPHILNQSALSDTAKSWALQHAIRKSTFLDKIEPWVADGASLEDGDLRRILDDLARNGMPLDGWCSAIAAFQKHCPTSERNTTWCRTMRDFDKLMRDVLIHGERLAAGVGSTLPIKGTWSVQTTHGYTSKRDYFTELEGWIRDGRIEWRPTVAKCELWVEEYRTRRKYSGLMPARLAGLLGWLRERAEERQKIVDGGGLVKNKKGKGKQWKQEDGVVESRDSTDRTPERGKRRRIGKREVDALLGS
ncbi:hypothetical protein HDV00_004769 [Rhizophlyctis rosea]|nr:hypothetical protein HDV00_004769 [Rhizophlyctis rosea]